MTTIYHYDRTTGAFLHETVARLDPRDEQPLVPARATLIAPPACGDNEVAVWDGAAWDVQPDFRGREYWLPDGSQHRVAEIGVTPPEAALDAPPPVPREVQLAKALETVDRVHARYLEQLTGNASLAERDTWKPKEEAARAYVSGTASAPQADMLLDEATGAETTVEDLALIIIQKADATLNLVGKAAGLRARAKRLVAAAADEVVPIEDVEASIAAVFATLEGEIAAAIAALPAN